MRLFFLLFYHSISGQRSGFHSSDATFTTAITTSLFTRFCVCVCVCALLLFFFLRTKRIVSLRSINTSISRKRIDGTPSMNSLKPRKRKRRYRCLTKARLNPCVIRTNTAHWKASRRATGTSFLGDRVLMFACLFVVVVVVVFWNWNSLTASNISGVLKVRLGEYDVSVTTEQLPYEELDVSHVMVHPQFNNLSLANDIALVRFVKPARRRHHIDVACMPHPGQIAETEGTRCVVTGWGRKSEGPTSSSRFLPLFFFSYP